MKHLKANYPYLFSLAVRTNPFDTNASVITRDEDMIQLLSNNIKRGSSHASKKPI
jgi:hypothetical protein